MKTKKEEFSFLIVSNLNDGNISFKISKSLVNFIISSIIIFMIFIVIFIMYFKDIFNKNLFIEKLIKENAQLIDTNNKLRMLDLEISKLKEFEKKVRNITTKDWNILKDPLNIESGINNKIFAGEDIDKYLLAFKKKRSKDYKKENNNKKKKEILLNVIPNIVPLKGWISRGFGEKIDENNQIYFHNGLDIVAPLNTPIIASSSGIVTYSGWQASLGNIIEIDHGFGYITRYGHCGKIKVNKGDFIKSGQIIAFVGNTGRSTGPHLHFEVIKDGKNLDPEKFILK